MVGNRDIKHAEKLQLDKDCTLEKAITARRQSETIKSLQYVISGTTQTPDIENVGTVGRGQKKKVLDMGKTCHRCGAWEKHAKSQCPAKDADSYKCKILDMGKNSAQ